MLKAILFDLDGLLVDTEGLNMEVVVEVCRELGLNLTSEEKRCSVGVTNKKFYEDLFRNRKINFDLDKVLARHFQLYDARLAMGVKDFPGAKYLPRFLKTRSYQLALVSGSTKKQVEIILGQLGIQNFFDVIVTADDIMFSKPDPEGYLLAAKQLGIGPQECLVLEDATQGIIAAKRARMKVIGVMNSGDQDLSSADAVVKDLTEIEFA